MSFAWIVWNRSLSPSNQPRPDHMPIVIVIQSEGLKHSKSPRNQSSKHPDSGCLGISRVVNGSALSKGSRSGPEAFRAGHFEDLRQLTVHEKPLAPNLVECLSDEDNETECGSNIDGTRHPVKLRGSIHRFCSLKFPTNHTSYFGRKSLKYFVFGKICQTDATDFFREDIPMLSRVK